MGDSRIDRVQVPIRVPDKTREDFFDEDERSNMINLRIWIIASWIALPKVMFGRASLLRFINRGNVLSPFPGELLSCGARARRCTPADVAPLLHLSRPDGTERFGQAFGEYGALPGPAGVE